MGVYLQTVQQPIQLEEVAPVKICCGVAGHQDLMSVYIIAFHVPHVIVLGECYPFLSNT